MLCNYFNWIDNTLYPGKYQSYLLFGESLPEGRNVYVLRTYNNPSDGGDVEIWSPVTADCFYFKLHNDKENFCGVTVRKASHMEVRLNDPVCTMKHIWCVVG